MGRIQSSVGLVTGVPIDDTVDQLMQLNAIPRDRLESRNDLLEREQVALTELTTLVVGVELTTDRLGQSTLYRSSKVSSSNPDTLTVRNTGSPTPGTYSFKPIRTAQSQQLSSSLFASAKQKVSTGEVVIHTGGFLDQSASLDSLNGGQGVARGFIKITDKSGASDTVDLRYAQNAADVVDAINASDKLSIVAEVDGDHFRLTDISGGGSNLQVAEVGGGKTAADLGFGNVTTSDSSLDGSSIQSLSRSTGLRSLRDGRGLELPASGTALQIDLSDGSSIDIEFELETDTASLGQLIDEINAAGGTSLEARIAADGKSIEIEDLTTGASEFTVSSPLGSLAEQLGLDGTAVGGVIQGDKLIAGLSDVLLNSLNGGKGFEGLGEITITDRSGNSANVDLSAAETLDDVIDLINASSLEVSAQLNKTKTGIEISDTSGSTSSDLIIADADASNSATALQIAGSVNADSIDSGSLNRQFVSATTQLADFNQGRGVSPGTIQLTDSAGATASLSLAGDVKTIGDVIKKINALSIKVTASINETGDGILITDDANGSGSLSIADTRGGTTAAELGISGIGTSLSVDGETVTGIDGSRTLRIATTADTTLEDLVAEINSLSSGPLNANLLNLNDSGGVRLLLSGTGSGAGNRVAIDSNLDLGLTETAAARDALLAFGASDTSGGVIVSSSDNTFEGLVKGLTFDLQEASDVPVTITVEPNQDNVAKQLEAFVDQFNLVRTKLDELTVFDEATQSVGILFGTGSALRVDVAFGRLLSSRVSGGGEFQSLGQVGIELDETGKLSFNRSRFDAAFAESPNAIRDFFTGREVFDEARYNVALAADPDTDKADFTTQTEGFSAIAKSVAESLAGVERGALLNRTQTLNQQIDQNRVRIENMDLRLEKSRTRLLNQFYNMELVISKLQNNLSSLSQIQYIGANT